MATIATGKDALKSLESRIDTLEQILSDKVNLNLDGEAYTDDAGQQIKPLLYNELDDLNNTIDSLISQDPTLISLVENLQHLKLWSSVEPLDPESSSLHEVELSLSLNQKMQIILSRENELKTLGQSINEIHRKENLVNPDQGPGSVENITSDSCPSWSDLAIILNELGVTEKSVILLLQIFEQLSIRTGQVLYQWLERIVIKDNQLWVDIEERVGLLEKRKRIKKLEREI